MMLEASPFWQNAFLVGVLVAIGWCVWNGWRVGVVRAVCSLVGMVVGFLVGMAAGSAVGAVAGLAVPVYGGMIGLVVGAVAGLAAYVVVLFLSALLFKRTGQQRTPFLRLGYGAGGALVGAFVGVSIMWAALLFVRGLGGFCEASVETPDAFYALPMPEPAALALVKLKKSIEAGDTGKWLESVDPMPREFYSVLDRLGKLMADPVALERFLEYPDIREVLVDSRFLQLTSDPEVQDIARSQDTAALMSNPKLLDAVSDPGLITKLQKIDIQKALDFALGDSAAGPQPPPSTP